MDPRAPETVAAGSVPEAAKAMDAAIATGHEPGASWRYNAACCKALTGKPEKAIAAHLHELLASPDPPDQFRTERLLMRDTKPLV